MVVKVKSLWERVRLASGMNMNSQGPWFSTVHNNHSNTSTHVQGESERSELAPCNITSDMQGLVWGEPELQEDVFSFC